MRIRIVVLSMVLLSALLFPPQPAHAQSAAPVGYWTGHFSNGEPLILNLAGNGDAFLSVSGMDPVTGTWSWSPTYVGGIITITYNRVGFVNHLYYSITFITTDEILFGDQGFTITLWRQW